MCNCYRPPVAALAMFHLLLDLCTAVGVSVPAHAALRGMRAEAVCRARHAWSCAVLVVMACAHAKDA